MAKALIKNHTPIDNAQALHEWCLGLLEDGRKLRKPYEAQWWENLATLDGDLWVEFDAHQDRLYELDKPAHRVRLPINLAQPAVRTEYAKLLKNRPVVRAIARSADRKDLNSAQVADSMLDDYAEAKFQLPKVRRRAMQWAITCGAGGIFVDYDPSLSSQSIDIPVSPDGTPAFTRQEVEDLQALYRQRHQAMQYLRVEEGELVISPVSPFQWVFDFSKHFVEEAGWAIYSEVMDVDVAFRRWGVDIEEEKIKMSVLDRRLFGRNGLPAASDPLRSNNQRLAEIHRMYVKPGHRFFPDGAHIVFTESELIDAEVFPFEDGEIPLSVMGHIFRPMSQHPGSILQQIKPLVLEISKTESQMIENRNLMANPMWIEFRQHRIDGEIENRPGFRVEIDYVPNVPEPHPVEMPDLPSYVHNLPSILGEHVLEISGQNETAQGQVPPGARSGVAIAYLTEENDTKLGPTIQEWEEMNERCAGQILSRFGQFYKIPRLIHIYKPHSEPEVLDFVGSILEGVAGVKVQTGSALPRSLAAKQQFTMDLYDRGLIRNPRTIKDMLEVGEGESEEWEKDMQQAERENRRMQEGKRVQAEQWHNHMAHLYVLHDFMKSAEWDELSEQARAPFVEHEAEHQNFVRMQQQQQAAMQQGSVQGGNTPTSTQNGQNQPNGPQGQYSGVDDIGAVAEAGAVQQSIS